VVARREHPRLMLSSRRNAMHPADSIHHAARRIDMHEHASIPRDGGHHCQEIRWAALANGGAAEPCRVPDFGGCDWINGETIAMDGGQALARAETLMSAQLVRRRLDRGRE